MCSSRCRQYDAKQALFVHAVITDTAGNVFAKQNGREHEQGDRRAPGQAVHEAGSRICLQILHAGRYGYTPFSVSASRAISTTRSSDAADLGTSTWPRGWNM